MSRRNRLIRQLEARWIACYGEPPPIRTDPELMLRILDDMAARELEGRREVALGGGSVAAAI